MDTMKMIRELRKKANLSQQQVADAIDMARNTYSLVEAGKRELKISELVDLAKYYEISPSDLLKGKLTDIDDFTTPYVSTEKETIVPRDLDPQVDSGKLREVLLYVLDKVGAKPNVGETVLYKILYFIDFDYYEKYGKSITGLTYIRNHFGPTPARNFSEVVDQMRKRDELDVVETKYFTNTQKKYLPIVTTSLELLDARELRHINEELGRLSDKSASELSELSHKDTPWRVAKQGKPISYRDVFYRTDLTAVTEPGDEL